MIENENLATLIVDQNVDLSFDTSHVQPGSKGAFEKPSDEVYVYASETLSLGLPFLEFKEMAASSWTSTEVPASTPPHHAVVAIGQTFHWTTTLTRYHRSAGRMRKVTPPSIWCRRQKKLLPS